jgi:hypothetical protein
MAHRRTGLGCALHRSHAPGSAASSRQEHQLGARCEADVRCSSSTSIGINAIRPGESDRCVLRSTFPARSDLPGPARDIGPLQVVARAVVMGCGDSLGHGRDGLGCPLCPKEMVPLQVDLAIGTGRYLAPGSVNHPRCTSGVMSGSGLAATPGAITSMRPALRTESRWEVRSPVGGSRRHAGTAPLTPAAREVTFAPRTRSSLTS